MSFDVDFLVIGAGLSGVCAADILCGSGQRTALVSRNIGSSGSKNDKIILNSLLYISYMYDKYKQVLQFCSESSSALIQIDFKKVRKFVETMTVKVRKTLSDIIESNKAEFYEGSAEFTGRNSVLIKKTDGTEEECAFKKCLIASGAVAKTLDMPNGVKFTSISSVLDFESVPQRVVIIGAGFVGMEAASFFLRLGSEVTVIEKNDRILEHSDQAIFKKYEDTLKKKKISILTGENIKKIERIGQKYVIFLENSQIESEQVFTFIGSSPSVNGLNLNKAEVKMNEDGSIFFDSKLCTSNKNIFVAGSAAGANMHSGWSFFSSHIAAKNMLGKTMQHSITKTPEAFSADPLIINIGLTEEEARKLDINCGAFKYNLSDICKTFMPSVSSFMAKIVYDKSTKKFLGFQTFGDMSMELASSFSILLQSGITADKASDFIFLSPILNELMFDLSEKLK